MLLLNHEERGQGSVLLFVHAFPLSHQMWQPQIEEFARDFRVIAPDLRGFGDSPRFEADQSTCSIETMADDLNRLLDTLQISEPIVLCGLSMGGYTALQFARKYQSRLRGLILCDTRAEPDDAAGRANRDQMIEFAREHSARDVIEKLLPKLLGETTRTQRPDVVQRVREIAAAQSPQAIADASQAMRDRADGRQWMKHADVPALVICGEEDTLTTPEVARGLTELLPRATLKLLPQAGHLSNLETPAVFNVAVREFLQAL